MVVPLGPVFLGVKCLSLGSDHSVLPLYSTSRGVEVPFKVLPLLLRVQSVSVPSFWWCVHVLPLDLISPVARDQIVFLILMVHHVHWDDWNPSPQEVVEHDSSLNDVSHCNEIEIYLSYMQKISVFSTLQIPIIKLFLYIYHKNVLHILLQVFMKTLVQ